MGRPGGQPFGSRSLPSQLLICRCTKPFDRKKNYKQHLMIFNPWPFPGFPCPVPVFLYPFPVLPRNSGFSQETCGLPGNSWVFPGNFRFSVNTFGLFTENLMIIPGNFQIFSWNFMKIPWKLLVFSGHFSVSFEFSCGNHTVFSW